MTVRFFASIAEITGCESISLGDATSDTYVLRERLEARWPSLKNATYALAVNRVIVSSEPFVLSEGDEVALLPPFSGG
jgi:molybdopterin converting factor small subunit